VARLQTSQLEHLIAALARKCSELRAQQSPGAILLPPNFGPQQQAAA
jgi:hypothetical protein